MSLEEVKSYMNSIRRDFAGRELSESSVKDNPFDQYAEWFEEAVNCQILDPHAMCLSTVSADGAPSSRIVYLRDIQKDGLVFYTNYLSRKGRDLEANPKAALNLHWGEIERQIRIEGEVVKAPDEMSDAYFSKRPKESKIGAWASAQSDQIVSRGELEEKVKLYTEKYSDKDVDRPPYWGGYILLPTRVEFWQGRPSRLHDRIVYLRDGDSWKLERLSP